MRAHLTLLRLLLVLCSGIIPGRGCVPEIESGFGLCARPYTLYFLSSYALRKLLKNFLEISQVTWVRAQFPVFQLENEQRHICKSHQNNQILLFVKQGGRLLGVNYHRRYVDAKSDLYPFKCRVQILSINLAGLSVFRQHATLTHSPSSQPTYVLPKTTYLQKRQLWKAWM